MTTLTARLPQSATSPDVFAGCQQVIKGIYAAGVDRATLDLVHMRASQINGCAACIAYGVAGAETSGLSTDRLLALPGWRDSPAYDEAERAALELTEAMTRLADHPGAVTDEIWADVAEHFDDRELSALVSMIGVTNFFNRINTTLRTPPGSGD
jgi:AhpD family alkylhydroperoxidase